MAVSEAGDFGRALKRYRLAAGLSQEALEGRTIFWQCGHMVSISV